MSVELAEREPAPTDATLTPASLAEATGLTRQAIDRAIRQGRIPAYRHPGTRRIWMLADEVPSRYRPTIALDTRLRRLEAAVGQMQAQHSTPSPADQSDSANEMARLRAENATLKSINQLLLAEGADRDTYDLHRDTALDLLRQATLEHDRAIRSLRDSKERYREALAQTQFPAQPPRSG